MVSGDSAKKGRRRRGAHVGEGHLASPGEALRVVAAATPKTTVPPGAGAAGLVCNDTEVNGSSKQKKKTKKRKRERHQTLEDEGQRRVDATTTNNGKVGGDAEESGPSSVPAADREPQTVRIAKRSKNNGKHQPLTCTTKVAEYGAILGTSGDSSPVNTEAPVKETKKKKAKRDQRQKKKGPRASLCRDQHAPPSGGRADGAEPYTNGDHDTDDNESATLEGVVHDGTMYLVDARRRVFSAQRDEGGNLVEVGTFDEDCSKVMMIVKPPSASPAEKDVSLAAAEAEASSSLLPSSSPPRPSSSNRDPATLGVTDTGSSKKKLKKKGKQAMGVDGGDGLPTVTAEAGIVVEYPFEVEECDHCETSERAYSDIAPLLSALAAELGKLPQDLVIYDPYYCQGSTVGRLASLGFPRVHNRKEDFYEVIKNGNIPEHDVVVTNPPFSGEHVPNILSFCARPGAKPWFLLLPNYVYLKDYYERSLGRGSARGATLPFYLTPPKRYMYYSPQGSRLKVKSSERKTSPFNTFWYVRLGEGAITSKILQSYDAMSRKADSDARCCVARTTQQIPYKMMDSNDPRRKKARDRQRSIDRIRKKKSEWIVG